MPERLSNMPRGVKTARTVNKAPRRDLITKDYDGTQEYATVTKMLGNGRVLVVYQVGPEKKEIQATIRGSMRRREWVNVNDLVLVAFRDFGETHDIIRKFSDTEVHELRRLGELDLVVCVEEDDDEVVFEDI